MTVEPAPPRRHARPWVVAVAGVLGGALLALGAISFAGVLILPVALVVCGLVLWAGRLRAVPWLVLGVALVPLWVAVDNRGGPGTRCTTYVDGETCRELHDPLPWLVAAVAVLLVALLLGTLVRRGARSAVAR